MLDMFKKYSDFTGRSVRSEYWGVLIGVTVMYFVGAAIAGLMFLLGTVGALFGALFIFALSIAGLVVALATTARRCRDAGINPWWTAATFIPYIGFIVTVVVGILETHNDTDI